MFFVIGVYIIAVLSAYGYVAWYVVTEFVLTGQTGIFGGFVFFIIGALAVFFIQAMVTPLMYPLAYIAEGIWWLMKKAWHGIIRRRTHA
ncbi:hypothetical protein G3601_002858 [Salmonella enterica]|uniref:Uncharacterized protein n=1 Tax=Salmonella enterica subsp. enterica serovar Java TaxID=224729 RepID=A0A3Z6QQQ1_SALEB|nr:hypothetical protein [Salmonella enterica subsp. enterica serovar Java]EAO0162795.1 hypothetical protein [Salmonella enterica]ECF6068484.1 hypothetical protein [Salmonella enterica subsp. diarizonae]EDQ0178842.1 hypothetical protein [Salmonella enterica subsp. enterica serovar 4,[5],12:b:-]EEE5610903.1 hypothetical protein [Salmonella enterica subsp. enterica serovar Typhimurium]